MESFPSFCFTTFLILIGRGLRGAQSCSSGADPVEFVCATVNLVNVVTPFDENKVQIFIWTNSNAGDLDYDTLKPYSKEDLPKLRFNPQNPTYVLFHGYTGEGTNDWILQTKTKILSLGNANVISVNYEKLVRRAVIDLEYLLAICNAYKVARHTAEIFDWLHLQTGLDANDMYLIGFSLGSHVAGITGHYMMRRSIGQAKRITGLDPAGPFFSDLYLNGCRLDKSQAGFVDIIHTNGCDLPPVCLGIDDVIGHLDFFPNGGVVQPGCVACSHTRAPDLFVESINSTEFKSWPCSSWLKYQLGLCTDCKNECPSMGFNLKTNFGGTFYLSTNGAPPYAKGNVQ